MSDTSVQTSPSTPAAVAPVVAKPKGKPWTVLRQCCNSPPRSG